MLNISVCFPLLAVLALVICGSYCGGQEEEWRMHSARVEKFKCRVPQARSYHWHELDVDFEINDKEIIVPWSTVLHRCESSGCCKGKHVCLSRKTEIVHLTFARIGNTGKKFFTVPAVNHTECSCQKNSDRPK